MNETSGYLAQAAKKYLKGQELNSAEILRMKQYLRQWIGSPAWDQNPHGGLEELKALRVTVAAIANYQDLNQAISVMTDMGMDPL